MGLPVYPFRAVLRELRRDAGLSILAAGEATGYCKYERWESGQTRVGGQYLRSIAEAFAVTDDLYLLLYAWLLDQLTPETGCSPRRLGLDDLHRYIRFAPDTVIDLHERKALVVEPGRHVDLARGRSSPPRSLDGLTRATPFGPERRRCPRRWLPSTPGSSGFTPSWKATAGLGASFST